MSAPKPLAERHAQLIRASAISDEVRDARGYWTATTKYELRDLGFGVTQQRPPALVIPIWGVSGETVLHQTRPDNPRRNGTGRALKYETPAKARMALDVPPMVRPQLGNPEVPLLITEGARKADSAVTAGLCCVSILGVWNWRGSSDAGGKVALGDWESVALNGRSTYVVFDSDIATKPEVHEAMRRLKGFLEAHGAGVSIIYLPAGDHGAKVGLDDYLAAGHDRDELLALAVPELRRPEQRTHGAHAWDLGDYRMVATDGIYRRDREGALHRLTDFSCVIRRKVVEDDGIERRQRYELLVQQGERIAETTIAATEFEGLRWIRNVADLDLYVAAGMAVRDHARAAIDLASKGAARATVYTHLGWRQFRDRWCYLHAGGAIGAEGAVDGIEVQVSSELARFELSLPTVEAEQAAVRRSLDLLELAPEVVMVPLLAAVYRPPLGYVDNSLYVVGRTGVGKSELTALAQQHYGAGLDREHLPGSWGSTANALRAQLFAAKDALLVVDDYAPGGGRVERENWERKAAELLRAQGNASGRGRADTGGGLRPVKPPRGLLLTSGEDIPSGHSVRARAVIVEVGRDDVRFDLMDAAQRAAEEGVYAEALAGYLRWLAPRLDHIRDRLREQTSGLRDKLRGVHRRTPTATAQLAVGWHWLLVYAEAIGAVEAAERATLWERGWTAFQELADAQAEHQADAEPTQRFLDLLTAAIASGRAHVAGMHGGDPEAPTAWGWRLRIIGTGANERGEWQPQGDRVGWLAGTDLYLGPEASYRAAQAMAGDGPGIGAGQKMLSKRLKEQGLLVTTGKDRPAVQRRVEGAERKVLHVHAERVRSMSAEKSGSPGSPGSPASTSADLNSNQGEVNPIFEPDPADQGDESGSQIGFTPTQNGRPEPGKPGEPDICGDVPPVVEDDVLAPRVGSPNGEAGEEVRRQHEAQTHLGRRVEWWQQQDGKDVCAACHPPLNPADADRLEDSEARRQEAHSDV